MKKYLFFVTILFLLVTSAHAAKPSDFGLKEGNLISASDSGDPDVFIINEHGYKRLFLNPVIFNYYGHLGGFKNIKKTNTEARDSFPTSSYYRDCEANDPKIYAIKLTGQNEASLRWVNVTGDQAVQDDPDFFKKVFCINTKEFNWYKKEAAINSTKDVQTYDRTKRWGTAPILSQAPKAVTDPVSQSPSLSVPPIPVFSPALIVNEALLTKLSDLKDGDIISAADYGDPDYYLIKIINGKRYRRLLINPADISKFYDVSKAKKTSLDTRNEFEQSFYVSRCNSMYTNVRQNVYMLVYIGAATSEQTAWNSADRGARISMPFIKSDGKNMAWKDFDDYEPGFTDRIFCITDAEYDIYLPQGLFSVDFPVTSVPTYSSSDKWALPSSEVVPVKLIGRVLVHYKDISSMIIELEDGREEHVSYLDDTDPRNPKQINLDAPPGTEIEFMTYFTSRGDNRTFNAHVNYYVNDPSKIKILPKGTLNFIHPMDINSRIANAPFISRGKNQYLYFNAQTEGFMFIDPSGYWISRRGHNLFNGKDLLDNVKFSMIGGEFSSKKDMIRGMQTINLYNLSPGTWAIKIQPFPYSDPSSYIKIDARDDDGKITNLIPKKTLQELHGKFLFFKVI